MSEEKPLIVITGPTASGKTALSIQLAKELDTEIISADSMQIYKYFDIGSAKPTEEEKQGVFHHMMDFLEPDCSFSVAQYVDMANACADKIYAKGKIPIVTGGTGLYISSLVDGIEFSESVRDEKLRSELQKIADERGGTELLVMLREFDAETADKLHSNDIKRIIRAIEVYKTTSITISEQNRLSRAKESRYKPYLFAIEYDRALLYERINQRVEIMFHSGLIDEVKSIAKRGYTRKNTAMQAIGYKEIFDYFDGLATLDETKNIIKQSSRRYAKRQLTWFRRDERVVWLDPKKPQMLEQMQRTLYK